MITTTDGPGMAGDLLSLVQWLSPAFPLGSFAYSHGLEHAISTGTVRTAADVQDWVGAILREGSGRCDAILLAATLGGADPRQMDALGRAMAAGPERSREAVDQGRAFLETTNTLCQTDWHDLILPVAVGVQARGLDLPAETVIALYLQSFASNLVLGAVRFVPLGQTDGQRVLRDLGPLIASLGRELADAGPEALTSAALGADMAAMAHEHQEVRLFRT